MHIAIFHYITYNNFLPFKGYLQSAEKTCNIIFYKAASTSPDLNVWRNTNWPNHTGSYFPPAVRHYNSFQNILHLKATNLLLFDIKNCSTYSVTYILITVRPWSLTGCIQHGCWFRIEQLILVINTMHSTWMLIYVHFNSSQILVINTMHSTWMLVRSWSWTRCFQHGCWFRIEQL